MKEAASISTTPLEAPFVTSDMVDRVIGRKANGFKHIVNVRKRWRREIGLDNDAAKLSFGRYGTVSLIFIPVYVLVQTDQRWDSSFAFVVLDMYKKRGLDSVINSKSYEKVISLLGNKLQGSFDPNYQLSLSQHITRSMRTLMQQDSTIRKFAERLSAISNKVAANMPSITRSYGRLVRFEGHDNNENALVTINTGGIEELRQMDAGLLKDAGVLLEGEPFYKTTLKFSPDNEALVITPAASSISTEESKKIEDTLRTSETPIPEPPAVI